MAKLRKGLIVQVNQNPKNISLSYDNNSPTRARMRYGFSTGFLIVSRTPQLKWPKTFRWLIELSPLHTTREIPQSRCKGRQNSQFSSTSRWFQQSNSTARFLDGTTITFLPTLSGRYWSHRLFIVNHVSFWKVPGWNLFMQNTSDGVMIIWFNMQPRQRLGLDWNKR